jgi:hypothetical protein
MSSAIKKFVLVISAIFSFFILVSSIYFVISSSPTQPEHVKKMFWLYCVSFSSMIFLSSLYKLGLVEHIVLSRVTINKKIARIIGTVGFSILSFGPLGLAIHDKYTLQNASWNLDLITIGLCGIIIGVYFFLMPDSPSE